MNGLILGLYGVYLLWVGVTGKSENLLDEVDADMPGFIPWALSIVALIVLAQSDATAKLVKPFIALLILNFILRNFTNLKTQLAKLQALSTGSSTQ